MSQRQVLEFLKKKRKYRKYYTVAEISKAIGINVGMNCTKLRQYKMINFIKIKINGKEGMINRNCYAYRWKK